MDFIRLNNLEFYTYHGVFSEEKKLGQRLKISVEIGLMLEKACVSDNVEDTIDYTTVYEGIRNIVCGKKRYNLLEKISGDIAKFVLNSYLEVKSVRVKIIKSGVPYPGIPESEVEIYRENE
jgi:dihydroneopterin aldolase